MQLEIIFLGTGGSWPSKERNVQSIGLKRGSEMILFDCGEGTQRQLQKSGYSYMQISKIFISHFHGDHVLGIPGLLQTMEINGRKEKLEIYGPKGTKNLVSLALKFSPFRLSYRLVVNELKDSDSVEFEGYRIYARKAVHIIPSIAYALVECERPGKFNKNEALQLGVPEGRLFGKLQRGESVMLENGKKITPKMVMGPPRRGRKITISGDTLPSKTIVELARNSDVLIHDATFAEDFRDKANEYGHSTAKQAAMIAKEAQVKSLYLVHISPRYRNPAPILHDAKTVFENSFVPSDLSVIEIKYESDFAT
jgi:ribonuclease Z